VTLGVDVGVTWLMSRSAPYSSRNLLFTSSQYTLWPGDNRTICASLSSRSEFTPALRVCVGVLAAGRDDDVDGALSPSLACKPEGTLTLTFHSRCDVRGTVVVSVGLRRHLTWTTRVQNSVKVALRRCFMNRVKVWRATQGGDSTTDVDCRYCTCVGAGARARVNNSSDWEIARLPWDCPSVRRSA
jgi:hypothetical protein